MDIIIIFFCLLVGITTSSWSNVAVNGDKNPPGLYELQGREEMSANIALECTSFFQPVGDRCIMADKSIFGPWEMIRDGCVAFGGDLPNLEDSNFLADIIDYLHEHDLDDVNYWVGSTDELSEGDWYWINDQSEVKMGTPLWGDIADEAQQPTGGILENCGVLLQVDHFYMHDAICTDSYSLLCEQIAKSQVGDAEKVKTNATYHRLPRNTADTYSSVECPNPYQMIYGKCLFINTLEDSSWPSQKSFCENLGGYMVKIDDANFLGAIYDHLTEADIKLDFWIGANDEAQEGHWTWHDGTAVRLGTPFWGDSKGDDIQEPDGGAGQNFGVIFREDHYHFGDLSDKYVRYVICQIDV